METAMGEKLLDVHGLTKVPFHLALNCLELKSYFLPIFGMVSRVLGAQKPVEINNSFERCDPQTSGASIILRLFKGCPHTFNNTFTYDLLNELINLGGDC
jgi:hypothetical protein